MLSFLKYPGEINEYRFPEDTPQVSIIIPTYNNVGMTLRSINNIRTFPTKASYEIIVVDDKSSFLHRRRWKQKMGLKIVTTESNRGYLLACNEGISFSRGMFIVLLNNDTLVQAGWLDSLIDNFADPSVGLVGAKLIYPDGTLQEAGGIIFSDGTTANFGNRENPENPMYTYRREVDYCSGAAIAVRGHLIRQLGGYDTTYKNAYYEDTDLAMSIRSLGYKVLYEPQAQIIHFEHGSYNSNQMNQTLDLLRNNRRLFVEKWNGALASFQDRSDFLKSNFDSVSICQINTQAVIVIDDFPRKNHDSGSLRLHHIIQYYHRKNLRVILISSKTSVEKEYLDQYSKNGIQIIELDNPYLPQYLKFVSNEVTFVHVSRVHYMRYFLKNLDQYLSEKPLIFDTVDLHFVREMRESRLKEFTPRRKLAQLEKSKEEELHYIDIADISLVVSSAEQIYLSDLDLAENVEVLSNVHTQENHSVQSEKREGLIFVGNFEHRPNIDGLKWFLEDIYPIIQNEIGNVPLSIIGSPQPAYLEDSSRPEVKTTGWVPNISPYYSRAKVAIAPLRFGAGVKGKVGEAWKAGVPVVLTSIAAEGMHVISGQNALIADSEKAFAESVILLLQNDLVWQQLSREGKTHVNKHFGEDTFNSSMDNVLSRINNRSQVVNRQDNGYE